MKQTYDCAKQARYMRNMQSWQRQCVAVVAGCIASHSTVRLRDKKSGVSGELACVGK